MTKPSMYRVDRIPYHKKLDDGRVAYCGMGSRLVFKATGATIAEVIGPATRTEMLAQFAEQVAAYEMSLIVDFASGVL